MCGSPKTLDCSLELFGLIIVRTSNYARGVLRWRSAPGESCLVESVGLRLQSHLGTPGHPEPAGEGPSERSPARRRGRSFAGGLRMTAPGGLKINGEHRSPGHSKDLRILCHAEERGIDGEGCYVPQQS